MDKIEELLPGIEEFLTSTLASEPLSPFAEERRQFFIERLDIVKLPPTLPPREGRVLPPELLKETEEHSGIPVTHSAPDFAATQREISRSLVDPNPYQDDEEPEGPDNASEKNVKVYDDIDTADVGPKPDIKKPRPHSEIIIRPSQNSDEDDEEEDENDLYEIPVARQQLSAEDNSLSYGADGSSLATAGSTEELPDDVLESSTTSMGPPPVPPPLPPRRDIRFSDSGSKNSLNAEDKPPELPFRPPLPKRSELYTRSDKSDRSEKSVNSDPDLSADGDSTSYESFEEDNEHHDTEVMNKYDVQLPKKPKKKSTLKKSKKLSKSRSSSQWEISVPFRKLESIDISGELYHRGKLSWNRRIVAISNGCLAMYKPDKDARPMLVIPLTGYEATVTEREGRAKGYEVKMTHPNDDTHTFSVDFKEWASLWMEHINGTSRGQPPPKYHTHLARSFTGGTEYTGTNPATYGSKTDLTGSNSNVSTGSEGAVSEDNTKPKLRGNKVMRMGSFAFRATQFFENIGKKTSTKKKGSGQSSGHQPIRHSASTGDYVDSCNGILEESSVSSSNSTGNLTNKNVLTPTSDISYPSVFGDGSSSSLPTTPITDLDSPLALLHGQLGQGGMEEEEDEDAFAGVAHKGYLSIFSSFNKRRWGKRWCMVRENMFECYRNERSKQCELNFLLKPCVFRRAIAETNSELGLMILEAGREKITVEPLCREDMGPWVRILLIETSTSPVPEGLEEFMKETEKSDGDSSSVMSFSVLKQWDMGSLVPSKGSLATSKGSSSHDYEDPVETAATAAKLFSSDSNPSSQVAAGNIQEDESPVSANAQSVIGSEEVMNTTQSGAEKIPRISDNLVAYNKNKHTTDSGFYSVKGANSDSDSSCENSSRDVGELDGGYATLDSRTNQDSGDTASSSKSSSEERSSPSRDAAAVVVAVTSASASSDGPSDQPQLKHSASSSSSSQCVQVSHSSSSSSKSASFSSGSKKVIVEATESHSSITVSMSKSEHNCNIGNTSSSPLQSDAHHDSSSNTPSTSAFPPQNLDIVKRHSSSTSTQKSVSSSVSSSNTTIISPSGEEYSIVLKRSERSSSKSPETESPAPHNRTSGKLEDSVFEENENVDGDDDDLNNFADELVDSMTSKNSDESYYEPIGQQNSRKDDNMQDSEVKISIQEAETDSSNKTQQKSQQQPQTSSVIPIPANLDANSSLESEKLSCDSPVSISGKLEHNASAISSSGESSEHCDSGDIKPIVKRLQPPVTKKEDDADEENNDCPPPVPSSPVPELSSSKSSESLTGICPSPTKSPKPTSSSQPAESNGQNSLEQAGSKSNPATPDETPVSSKGNKKKGKKPPALKNLDGNGLSLPLCNGEAGSSLSPHDATSRSDLPVTPTTDTVNAMVENPDTTVEELKEVIDRLKIKQADIKRKRMAVHDKRQRVLSDEERLACEKEFAALERAGENTDLDIRVLQNQLDFLQGQTLEAMKAAQGKRKSGSRKKKKKKN